MSADLDQPKKNDNRNYDYLGQNFAFRHEYPVIASWIPAGSKVVDLACGNGSLMKYILERKRVDIEGIEITKSGVEFAASHGFKVRQGEIDKSETYADYRNGQFDYAVCNVTLMMVMYPEVLLTEMKRIAKYIIVSFANFAYIENRLDLLFHGRMPRPMMFGYSWYSTGHIHNLSVRDFERFCQHNGIAILKQEHQSRFRGLTKLWPNFLSVVSLYLCGKS